MSDLRTTRVLLRRDEHRSQEVLLPDLGGAPAAIQYGSAIYLATDETGAGARSEYRIYQMPDLVVLVDEDLVSSAWPTPCTVLQR